MTKCPTCGGPCETIPENATFCWESYESLVKGKVVAEGVVGKAHLKRWKENPTFGVLCVWRGTPAADNKFPVLVIKKENSMIQGGFG